MFESGTYRKVVSNSARPRHAVTTSVADQPTALHFKLLKSYYIKLVDARI